ncbi:MAG TPA: M23 family metallopeptidase [Gemmatimonadales bacterium]|nr:M23 family metallopeptidase [Gemmatimonadales bacterium]
MRSAWCVVAATVAGSSVAAQQIPSLPDSSGWGVHVLALAKAPDSSIWVGTYGQGIFRLGSRATIWDHIAHSNDTAAHSISWDFVHAFAFGPRGQIWYGTVGNGWGLSVDGGRTWKNWEYRELGPEWQYVAPNGIVTRGDTTYIATADGIKVTWDDGRSWAVITDSMGAASTKDSVLGRIKNQYVLAIALAPGNDLWISDLRGIAHSPDGGRTWHEAFPLTPCLGGCANRARALLVDSQRRLWVGTDRGVFRFGAEFGGWKGLDQDSTWCRRWPDTIVCVSTWAGIHELLEIRGRIYVASSLGFLDLRKRDEVDVHGLQTRQRFTTSAVQLDSVTLLAGRHEGVSSLRLGDGIMIEYVPGSDLVIPRSPLHPWFGRPIATNDQPYIDQTYRFGSTMGGNFQPHQGVEFNNPDGTPVHAIGEGIVVYSGPAEAGANTIAIRHDRKLRTAEGDRFVFSVYYHNSKLLAQVGQRVRSGDVIALVGNTGRATNDHLHLEVHVAPTTDSSKIVDPSVRYPPYNANPELWIEPLPGTGLVAGQAWDSNRQPVLQARIYGLVKPEPQETPFSFIETYGSRNHTDPVYDEHFAVSDVPVGEYVLGMEIEGRRVSRRIRVAAGQLTWVEFRPDAH